ncbi:MAG: potassium channel family protein [Gemmatimonadota bacterium]
MNRPIVEVGDTVHRASTVQIERGLRALGIAMMALLVTYPFFGAGTPRQVVMNFFMTIVFVSAIFAVSERRRDQLIAVGLAVPWFILTWMEVFRPEPTLWSTWASGGFTIAFLSWTLLLVLDFVLRAERVTTGVMWGAVAIYMLLGALWFSVFVMLERLQPGSFHDMAVRGGSAAEWSDLLYFSFVTLTTLGFGDIVPATLPARHFTVAAAVSGVLYLPIVLSRLVAASRFGAPSGPDS